jgi:hypothetical protein
VSLNVVVGVDCKGAHSDTIHHSGRALMQLKSER